ncbi:MAG: Sulfotransferase domain protein [Bacteroidetes bacterium]|jgi:hypothetical protein|nr:Sulfotransferase domain protein [Bacteroidota bacterium]
MERTVQYVKTSGLENLPEMAFIIGMGRSGTTLLTNMFNSHPNVVSTPENEFLVFAHQSYLDKDFNDKETVDSFLDLLSYNYSTVLSIWQPSPDLKNDIVKLKEKNFANVCKLVYLNYPFAGRNKEEVRFIVDKNPVYSLYLEKLQEIYPVAKYIVLVRDHRDNVLSRKKYADSAKSVFELAVSWNYYYEKIFRDLKKNGLDHKLVRYEDLVADPTAILKELCSYLDINYSDRMFEFQDLSKKIKEHVKENAADKVYNKISKMHSNLDNNVTQKRVKAYEKELSSEEIAIVNYVCSDFALKFGYLEQQEVNDIRPKRSWKFNKFKYELIVSVYYLLKAAYYKLPVSFRIKRLNKTK